MAVDDYYLQKTKEANLAALSEENLARPIEIVTEQWAGRLENPVYSTTKNPAAWEHGQTYFDLTVERPVAGTIDVSFYFISNRIDIPRDGTIGKVMSALPGAKFDGWKVLLPVNPEAAVRIEAIIRAFSRQRHAEQAAIEITEWVFTESSWGHCLEIYPVPDACNSKVCHVTWTAKKYWKAKDLVKVAQPLDRDPPAFAAYGNEEINPNSAFGWYRISDEVLGAMIAEKEAEEAERLRQKDEESKRYMAALAKAEKTGKPALMGERAVPCNDRWDDDCTGTDTIYTFVLPNGNRKEQCVHSWGRR